MFDPPHPGLILREWMDDMTVTQLARDIGMPRANLSMLLNGRMSVSAATALKLEKAFPKTSAEFWLRLQNAYDLDQAVRASHAA